MIGANANMLAGVSNEEAAYSIVVSYYDCNLFFFVTLNFGVTQTRIHNRTAYRKLIKSTTKT